MSLPIFWLCSVCCKGHQPRALLHISSSAGCSPRSLQTVLPEPCRENRWAREVPGSRWVWRMNSLSSQWSVTPASFSRGWCKKQTLESRAWRGASVAAPTAAVSLGEQLVGDEGWGGNLERQRGTNRHQKAS